MSIFNGINDIHFGPITMIYEAAKGLALPRVGESISDDTCSMTVLEVNNKTRNVKVLILPKETIEERLERYVEDIKAAMYSIADMMYNEMSTGMTSLVGWALLPDEEKYKYIHIVADIFRDMNKKGLFIIKMDESTFDV